MTAAEALAARGAEPRLGIVLGSGLGGLVDALEDAVAVPYAELEGFPRAGVAGHGGALVLRPARTACRSRASQGRKHVYEGGDPGGDARSRSATLKALGAEALLVTNAAGSLRPEVGPGRLMAITDHINLLGVNPLTGPNDDAVGPRFPSLRDAYDPELRRRAARRGATALDIDLAEGVYLATAGPTLRDAGRDPRVPHARRRRGRDVDRARGDPRPPRRAARRRRSRRSRTSPRAWAARSSRTSRRCATRTIAARDLVRLVERFAETRRGPGRPLMLPAEVIRRKRDGATLCRRGDRLPGRRDHRRRAVRRPGRRARDGAVPARDGAATSGSR